MSSLKLKHSGGNSVSLNPPTSAPTSSEVAFKLPNADGSNGQVIQTNGSGQLSFGTRQYYTTEDTTDISSVGASSKIWTFTNDPKKIEITYYRVRKAGSNAWKSRLRVGSVDHTTGYNDISHTASSGNSLSTARTLNGSGWHHINENWTGGDNLISGTMNITRVTQGKYVFDAHWIFHYHADASDNSQYWLNTHGEVDIGSNACSGIKLYTSSSGNMTSGHITVRTITE